MTRRHAGHEAVANGLARATHQNLPESGAVHGQPTAHPQSREQHPVRLRAVEMNHLVIAQNTQMRGLASLEGEFLQHRPGAAQERIAPRKALAQLEATGAQAIALGLGALLDVAMLFQGGQQPEHIILVQTQAP